MKNEKFSTSIFLNKYVQKFKNMLQFKMSDSIKNSKKFRILKIGGIKNGRR